MESITIKIEDNLYEEMNKAMNPYYSTKTEFVREAIRDKIKNIKKDQVLEDLKKYFGKAKTKTSYKQSRKVRERVGRQIAKEAGIKLD